MDVAENQSAWTSQKFQDMKKQFLEAKSEAAAFEVLERLVQIHTDDVDENAWLDCKDLILVLLETIPVEVMLLRQQVVLLQTLDHSPAHVVSTLAHFYTGKNEATSLLRQSAVAVAVAFARRVNETETYESVAKLIAPVCSQQEVKGELLHQLQESRNGEEHRFRVYQVLLEAMRQSSFNDELLPLFEHVIADLNYTPDVLCQLAALYFLSDFAVTNRAATELLSRLGVIDMIYRMLVSSKESPEGGFLFSACVKFFGCLAHFYVEVIDNYGDFVPVVMNMVLNYSSLDASQRMLAVETFAQLAYSGEAKKKLHAKAESIGLPGALFEMCNATRSGPVELRSRVIDAVGVLFEQGDEEIFSIWLQQMPTLPEILTTYLVRPFADIRKSAIRLLAVIMSRKTGVDKMLSSRENIEQFKEWLVDPQSETEWECTQLKNDLVREFRSADWANVDASLKEQLKHFFDAPKKAPQVATMEL